MYVMFEYLKTKFQYNYEKLKLNLDSSLKKPKPKNKHIVYFRKQFVEDFVCQKFSLIKMQNKYSQ